MSWDQQEKKFKNLRKTNKFTEEAQIVRCMDQIHADKLVPPHLPQFDFLSL